MKISIIIPVYNVEKYLRQCLDSVINQTYKDLEIICVNDASTDSSLSILEEYAQKDNRIIIVNNPVNSKLGPTRNNGMKYATGEYVHFLDSDDWMELNAYEVLANYIEKIGQVDVIHFLWNNQYELTGRIVPCDYKHLPSVKKIVNIENTPELVYNWRRSAWCKFYRRQFLIDKNIEFNDYPCLEDIEHSIHVLTEANSVYFIPDLILNYRANTPGSLLRSCYKFYDCALKSYFTNVEYCKKINHKAKILILEEDLTCLLSILYGSFVRNLIDKKELREIVKSIDLSIFGDNCQSYKWYVYYHDMMDFPTFIVKLKENLRRFTRNYMPEFHHFLVDIRRKYPLLRRL